MSDLKFDLSRSLKVKSNGAVGVPIYDFLLVRLYICKKTKTKCDTATLKVVESDMSLDKKCRK